MSATEVQEEQGGQGVDLQRYLNIVSRRHMQFLVPAFLGWLLVWGASWFLQARYKSGTLILVEQPTLPQNYVLPNVSDDLQERLQSIKQQVLSRTRLLSIIDRDHLYAGGRRKLSPDEKVARMVKDIGIELVEDSHGNQITAFKITYSSTDPHLAQAVAGELAGLVIHENLKVRLQESESTTDFIKKQLEIKAEELAQQEAKVRAFEAAHEGELPTQEASNLQIMNSLDNQLQAEQSALSTAKQQRVYLQAMLDETRATHPTARSANGTPTGLAGIDQQLDTLRSKLADMLSRYTDKYPDVVALKDQIAKTEKIRDAMVAEIKAHRAVATPGDDADVAALDPAAAQLRGQVEANRLEIASREKAVAGLQTKISEYRARLNAEPASQQQLIELNRGYEQSKQDYDELVKKRNESETATSMEQMQQGQRFTVLDPAPLPTKPDFPNRLKFCGMGIGFGLVLGIAVVALFELMDDRIHSESEIKNLLPAPILSEIPEVLSPMDERKTRRRMILAWATTALVVFCMLAGSAFSYLHN